LAQRRQTDSAEVASERGDLIDRERVAELRVRFDESSEFFEQQRDRIGAVRRRPFEIDG
jgi:hypothetical protein